MTGLHAVSPRFAFYSETCFHRTEHFLHDQMLGMRNSDVRVIARWGANLDEFPVPSLYLAEEFRTPLVRVRNAIVRRFRRDDSRTGVLPGYVANRLGRHLKRRPADLVYCLFGWNAAQLLDVLDDQTPLVFLAGGSDVTSAESLGKEYLSRLRLAFERASLILCGSRFLRGKLLALGAPETKLDVHYIGIAPPTEPNPITRPHARNGDVRFLAVSRLSPVKGILETIGAFARVAAIVPQARLAVVGDGELRSKCEALAKSKGLKERIRFHGVQSLAYVYQQMQEADIFVQHNMRTPSGQEESIGGSILEAMAHGLPVVATGSGGVAEAVEHGRTGTLVEPGDEAAMAQAMLELVENPKKRGELGAAGRALVINRFDLSTQNRRLESLLHGVVEGRSIR